MAVNGGIESLFVGYNRECIEYVGKLDEVLGVKKVEVVHPEDIAKMAW